MWQTERGGHLLGAFSVAGPVDNETARQGGSPLRSQFHNVISKFSQHVRDALCKAILGRSIDHFELPAMLFTRNNERYRRAR